MTKILVGGAGGAPSEGVIYSLQKSNQDNYIVGVGASAEDLILSSADKKILIPFFNQSDYKGTILKIIEDEGIEFVHFQNDNEILSVSAFRDDIVARGAKLFMPDHAVIETCVDKYKSYLKFIDAEIPVPRNVLITDEHSLREAFKELGNHEGKIWLRSNLVSGGGLGSISTSDFNLAKSWIDHFTGWGDFLAAEHLTKDTVTFLGIWWEGELVCAQTRRRKGWVHGNRSISGVTGVTQLGITDSDPVVTETAIKSVFAVSKKPHGIFGVDMTYDSDGVPNPTEINISRFFTTIRFFTEAGLNMPEIYLKLALSNGVSASRGVINPLENGLCWFRGMDTEPRLLSLFDFQNELGLL